MTSKSTSPSGLPRLFPQQAAAASSTVRGAFQTKPQQPPARAAAPQPKSGGSTSTRRAATAPAQTAAAATAEVKHQHAAGTGERSAPAKKTKKMSTTTALVVGLAVVGTLAVYALVRLINMGKRLKEVTVELRRNQAANEERMHTMTGKSAVPSSSSSSSSSPDGTPLPPAGDVTRDISLGAVNFKPPPPQASLNACTFESGESCAVPTISATDDKVPTVGISKAGDEETDDANQRMTRLSIEQFVSEMDDDVAELVEEMVGTEEEEEYVEENDDLTSYAAYPSDAIVYVPDDEDVGEGEGAEYAEDDELV